MAIEIIDTLKPKNDGGFPIAEAKDILVTEGLRLLEALADKVGEAELAVFISGLQNQIDQIVISASQESVVAPEVAAARVKDNGAEYSTLKKRLDASDDNLNEFDKLFTPISYTTTAGYVDQYGSIHAPNVGQNELTTESIKIKPERVIAYKFLFTDGAHNMWLAAAYYDTQGQFIRRDVLVNQETVSCGFEIINPPANATYMRISYRTYNGITFNLGKYAEQIYKDFKNPKNLWRYKRRGYIDSSGQEATTHNNDEVLSEKIEVEPGNLITLTTYSVRLNDDTPMWHGIGLYDGNDTFINRIAHEETGQPYNQWTKVVTSFIVPDNVKFIKVSTRLQNNGFIYVCKGAVSPDVFSDASYIASTEKLVPLFPSGGGKIRIDETNRIVTIPRDTLIIYRDNAGRAVYNSLPETVINFKDMLDTQSATTYKVFVNKNDNSIVMQAFLVQLTETFLSEHFLIMYVRNSRDTFSVNTLSSVEYINQSLKAASIKSFVKGVNHRGFNTVAPENTLPAYQLSKINGFDIVETDIEFTSDEVPVLLHDSTVDRTSNGTGRIDSMTFAEARELDFGSWKSEIYTGTKIPSFEEFIVLCRNIGLKAYVEIKGEQSQERINNLCAIVNKYGMADNITWISFYLSSLAKVTNVIPSARLGGIINTVDANFITSVSNLKNNYNSVFIDCSSISDELISSANNAGIPVELWTVNSYDTMTSANPYVSGFTSDSLNASQVMLEANL